MQVASELFAKVRKKRVRLLLSCSLCHLIELTSVNCQKNKSVLNEVLVFSIPLKFYMEDKDTPLSFHFLDTLEMQASHSLEVREHILCVYGTVLKELPARKFIFIR